MICLNTTDGSGCGLGNQLFRYAFARAIQLETGEKIRFYGFRDAQNPHDTSKWTAYPMISKIPEIEYVDCYNRTIQNYFKEVLPVRYYLYLIIQKVWRIFHGLNRPMTEEEYIRLYTVLSPIMHRMGVYICCTQKYIPYKRYKFPPNMHLVNGYYFSRDYFKNHEEQIKKDLLHPELISEKNQNLLKEIRSTNSVCLHMRYGDYLSEKLAKHFYVCGEEYFLEGIRMVCKDLKDPVFYVFSNEFDRVKQISFPEGIRYVLVEEQNSAVEDLQLMAQCKHFLIPNSTLSWWAQFLGSYEDKHVYGPTRWTRHFPADELKTLIEEDWIKVHAALPEI